MEATIKRIAGKLITAEDYAHIHKCLGVAVLTRVIFSLLFGAATVGTGWLVVHMALAVSSFQFRVPKKASVEHVLDSLYRGQVLLFSLRSVLVILWVHLEQYCNTIQHGSNDNNTDVSSWYCGSVYGFSSVRIGRLFSVITTHVLADVLAMYLQTHNEVRGVRRAFSQNEKSGKEKIYPKTMQLGRLFFSLAQCNATSQLVFVHNLVYVKVGAYFTMVVIQATAFIMTLRKKGLLSPFTWKIMYTLFLLSVAIQMFLLCSLEEIIYICILSVIYAIARLFANINKIVLMLFVFVLDYAVFDAYNSQFQLK
eukprot:m.346170 g.346170  ORF g.346170 m.346170 type:complete len:310 (-) comp28266_c0_seq1:19-948(-)